MFQKLTDRDSPIRIVNLYGPRGTGKTLVVKYLIKRLMETNRFNKFIEPSIDDILSVMALKNAIWHQRHTNNYKNLQTLVSQSQTEGTIFFLDNLSTNMTSTKSQLKDLQSLFNDLLDKNLTLVITTERKVSFLDEFKTDKEFSLPVGTLDSVSAAKILKMLAKNKEVPLNGFFKVPELQEISAHQLFHTNYNITPAYITEIVNLIKNNHSPDSIVKKMKLFQKGIELQMDTDSYSATNKIIYNGFEELAKAVKNDKESIFYRVQNFVLFVCFFRYG